jgi:hypothetical protein
MSGWRLAQFNLARLAAPYEDARIADFRDALDRVNALAEAAPGFVWRATGVGFDSDKPAGDIDERILPNMSVWETPEALAAFVYRSGHMAVLRRRHDWFEPQSDVAYQVLWWIPEGSLPSRLDGFARLDHLRAHGPSAFAFDFASRVPPPSHLELAP